MIVILLGQNSETQTLEPVLKVFRVQLTSLAL
jgi:hypothetical protein